MLHDPSLMLILEVIIYLIVLGAALAIIQVLEISASIKQIIRILLIAFICIYVLNLLLGHSPRLLN